MVDSNASLSVSRTESEASETPADKAAFLARAADVHSPEFAQLHASGDIQKKEPKKLEMANLDKLLVKLVAANMKKMILNHKLDCDDSSGYTTVTFWLKPDPDAK